MVIGPFVEADSCGSYVSDFRSKDIFVKPEMVIASQDVLLECFVNRVSPFPCDACIGLS